MLTIPLSAKQAASVAALNANVADARVRLSLYLEAITDAHDVPPKSSVALSEDGQMLVVTPPDAPPSPVAGNPDLHIVEDDGQ